jgi:putative LysE/RhtB family amino acid efflux pump
MVIRRSLTDGARAGIATGLGTAVADAIFAACGALGLASAASAMDISWLRAAGGLFLVALGVRALAERRRDGAQIVARVGHARAFFGTLLFTLASPISIVSFAAVAASLGVGARSDAVALVSGVFSGSMLWWLFLSSAVAMLRRRIPDGVLVWLGRASGAALLAFGVAALLSLRS